ncbi:MAG TPA: hypothetical protein VK763_02525 [Terriglobales bacterium]|nr:hypothetical protein [Terriglobales bacterium]
MTLTLPPRGISRHAWLFCLALLLTPFLHAAVGAPAFTPQARLGYRVGDQWEPAIAADGFGHVYVLYPQYGRLMPGLNGPLPSMTLLVSDNNGTTWQPPREITSHLTGQFDPQIVVDPADHRTVYAAWLQDRNRDAVVAKSVDFGQSWSVVVADRDDEDADKPVLAVRGKDVYLAFNREREMRVAVSHDGGITFIVGDVDPELNLIRALGGGATVDGEGGVHVAWAGYVRRNQVNLFVSNSSDGGKSWATIQMATSSAAPDCSAFRCEWGFLGAQITIASDAAGTLYALWNSGTRNQAPQRIYFASSTTAGETWSAPADVSLAPKGVEHAFPALVAGEADDVRIAWMDTRHAPLWNTFYRSSSNGGATWSAETRLSNYVPGYRYIRSKGYSFPFGDYFEMDIDNQGRTQAVWGEGLNFRSPGSIWYSNGR